MTEPLISLTTAAELANSAFATSLFGSIAGAFGGAYAAQRIGKRDRIRHELQSEIRNVNAAIAIAFSVLNTVLSLKKQHIVRLLKGHGEERMRLDKHAQDRKIGIIQGDALFRFQADMETIEPLSLAIDSLKNLVLTSISVTGRALNLALLLSEVIPRLNGAIFRRNLLIEDFKHERLPPGASLPQLYFGLPYADGQVNKEYPDTLNAIGSYADDSIFYSQLLCKDLQDHGHALTARFKVNSGDEPPGISEVNFDTPEARGLIPAEDAYQSILSAFQNRKKAVKTSYSWWR